MSGPEYYGDALSEIKHDHTALKGKPGRCKKCGTGLSRVRRRVTKYNIKTKTLHRAKQVVLKCQRCGAEHGPAPKQGVIK